MEFCVLGPLEARDDHGTPIALGAAKQRSLLALLLLARGRTVASERLIEEIWGGRAPETAHKSVQVYVSRLRKALGEARIVTHERGYALPLKQDELDLDRFDALLAEASDQPPERSAETLRRALSLFRGEPLEDLALEPWAGAEIARIEDRQVLALERRIDADLELGGQRDVVPELELLVASHPYREHLVEQLALALYRSGRQKEALDACREATTRLRRDLGLEPGPSLQRLAQQMLRQDEALDYVAGPVAPKGRIETRRHGWRLLVVGGAVIVAAAATALAVALTRSGRASLASLSPGVAIIDAPTGRVLSTISTTAITQPVEAVAGSGSFWVWNLTPYSVIRVDPATGHIGQRIDAPYVADSGWFLPDGRNLWFTGSHELARVDVDSGVPVDRYRLAPGSGTGSFGLTGIVRAAGSLWIASNAQNELLRVDPSTGRILRRIPIPNPFNVAAGAGAVWVTSAAVGLVRVDTETSAITATAPVPNPSFVAVGGGFAWASNETKGTVYKVDQAGNIVATYRTGDGARAVSFADGKLWVVNQDAGSVTGIDTSTGAERVFRFGHPLQSVAALGRHLLVEINSGHTYEDEIAALKGKVARLIVPAYAFDPSDPALAENSFAVQAEQATCTSLLRHPDAAPPVGLTLQPELATSMPTISRDRRTYMFSARDGYRFAPPSNARVTAQVIRYSIERALSPKLGDGPPAARWLSDIKGFLAYRSGRADHISGIRVKGSMISFTLRAPSSDFLDRLSLPFFCPVPAGTPATLNNIPTIAPPGSGPYTMSKRLNGEYMILTRNPNYHGPRAHTLNAIAFREGIDDEIAVGRVEAQTWDGVSIYGNSGVLATGGAIAKRFGPGRTAAPRGDETYHSTAERAVGYLLLNARNVVFRDVRVRRAVASAVSRSSIANRFGLVPAADILPPGLRLHVGVQAIPARPRVSRHIVPPGTVVSMAVPENCAACQQEAEIVRASLAPLGLDVQTKQVADVATAIYRHPASFDIVDGYTRLPYPDPASFLEQMLLHDAPVSWLAATTAAAVRRLAGLSSTARDKAAIRLAKQLQLGDVPLIAYGHPANGTLLSPRLQCRTWTAEEGGLDLAALCIR